MSEDTTPLDLVREAWSKHIATKFSDSPQVGDTRDYTYASGIKDCGRCMALDLIHPEDREEFDDGAMERMIRGRERDRSVSIRMTEAGQFCKPQFDVEMRQRRFEVQDRDNGPIIVVGKVDGVIVFDEAVEYQYKDSPRMIRRIPFEIKSGQSAMRVKSLPDLGKSYWTQHFLDQILLYIYAMNQRGHEVPLGALVLEQPGEPLILDIWLEDHLERLEQCLERSRAAWDVRHKGKDLPPFTEDSTLCWKCQHFRQSCSPPSDFGPGVALVDDEKVIALLDERGSLKQPASRYSKLHDQTKKLFSRIDVDRPLIAGNWEVSVSETAKGQRRMKIVEIAGEEEVDDE